MNPYEVLKKICPITTKPREGVNVEELVVAKFPKHYIKLFLFIFDWSDIDGVLDFLYGERDLGFLCIRFGIPKSDITEIINLIESNCEIEI